MVWSWVSADPRFGETRSYSLPWYLRTASNNSSQKLVPVSVALSKWDHFFSLADGVLVHSRATPWCYFSSNRLNTSVERDNVEWNLLVDWGNNAMTGPRLEIGSWDVIKPDDLTTFSHSSHWPPFEHRHSSYQELHFIHSKREISDLTWRSQVHI